MTFCLHFCVLCHCKLNVFGFLGCWPDKTWCLKMFLLVLYNFKGHVWWFLAFNAIFKTISCSPLCEVRGLESLSKAHELNLHVQSRKAFRLVCTPVKHVELVIKPELQPAIVTFFSNDLINAVKCYFNKAKTKQIHFTISRKSRKFTRWTRIQQISLLLWPKTWSEKLIENKNLVEYSPVDKLMD